MGIDEIGEFDKIELTDIKPIVGKDINILCPRCNGLGMIVIYNTPICNFSNEICPTCKGRGILDWCRRLVLGIKT